MDIGRTAVELTPSPRDSGRAVMVNVKFNGADFTGSNMDGLDMVGATDLPQDDNVNKVTDTPFPALGHNGKVMVAFTCGPTKLGNTTSGTTCQNNTNGPCTLIVGAYKVNEG